MKNKIWKNLIFDHFYYFFSTKNKQNVGKNLSSNIWRLNFNKSFDIFWMKNANFNLFFVLTIEMALFYEKIQKKISSFIHYFCSWFYQKITFFSETKHFQRQPLSFSVTSNQKQQKIQRKSRKCDCEIEKSE